MQHQNWPPADIIAALKKHGTSLAALSRKAGLSSSTLANALTRPWPKGELLTAQAPDIPPDVIWPERYFDEKVFNIINEFSPLTPALSLKGEGVLEHYRFSPFTYPTS